MAYSKSNLVAQFICIVVLCISVFRIINIGLSGLFFETKVQLRRFH